MADDPWLTIVGLGEDGIDGLAPQSRRAIERAEVVCGAARHLDLIGELQAECQTWPVPFADGIERLKALRGRRVVVLASGDPFWFGAGTVIARTFDRGEWCALSSPSVFSLAAARLGWPLQSTLCVGLHATPFEHLRAHLAVGMRAIITLRGGGSVGQLMAYLTDQGFGDSPCHIMEALGGPRERVRETIAKDFVVTGVDHPVVAAIEVRGAGRPLSLATGRSDDWFEHDGQLTKRPVRALTLSALAPVAGELLWDIGAGSGSISIEWLLADRRCRAIAIEADMVRAGRVVQNAARLGVERLKVIEGQAPSALIGLEKPDAVFIGGGLSDDLLSGLWTELAPGCRVVANAVTLESEALLVKWQARAGGSLQRFQFSEATAIGSRHGWKSAYPVVQWSGVR